MRWESEVKHAELTPAQIWRFKADGNFGGHSLLTPDSNTLSHHGVPGMHWGITTKEYVKKGYNTIARRQAILKQKRKAEAKAQFEEGYHRGQRVAANSTLVKRRTDKVLERKEGPKESLSDKAVSKATDFALKKSGLNKEIKKRGLDPFIPKAKDFLKQIKDEKLDSIYEDIQTEEGRVRLQRFATFMTKGVYQRGQSILQLAQHGGRRAVGKAIGKAALNAASIATREFKEIARNKYEDLRRVGFKELAKSTGDKAFNKFMDFMTKKRRRV